MSDTPKLDAEQIRAEARGYAEELAEWRRERAGNDPAAGLDTGALPI